MTDSHDPFPERLCYAKEQGPGCLDPSAGMLVSGSSADLQAAPLICLAGPQQGVLA